MLWTTYCAGRTLHTCECLPFVSLTKCRNNQHEAEIITHVYRYIFTFMIRSVSAESLAFLEQISLLWLRDAHPTTPSNLVGRCLPMTTILPSCQVDCCVNTRRTGAQSQTRSPDSLTNSVATRRKDLATPRPHVLQIKVSSIHCSIL